MADIQAITFRHFSKRYFSIIMDFSIYPFVVRDKLGNVGSQTMYDVSLSAFFEFIYSKKFPSFFCIRKNFEMFY